MAKGIHKKLAKARTVASGAGFLLDKLRAQFGDQFDPDTRAQVNKLVGECYQQASALEALTAKNAVQAERMHERRAANIAKNPSTPKESRPNVNPPAPSVRPPTPPPHPKGAKDEPARSRDG